jgi:hypothetical protein
MSRTMLTLAVGSGIDGAVAAISPTEGIKGKTNIRVHS